MKNKKSLNGLIKKTRPKNCSICNYNKFKLKFYYNKKPKIETDFKLQEYSRAYYECKKCTHWISNLIISKKFYSDFYVNHTYKDDYKKKFQKIISLKKKTDNFQRIQRILHFLKKNKINVSEASVLDVGSGLGIFPFEIRKYGLDTYSLDPDKSMSKFLKKNLKLNHFFCEFKNLKTNKKFTLITFNKVIEHVVNPIKFLRYSKKFLKKKNSFVYLEVPDTESARKISKNREEFCIEHVNCFTKLSLEILIKKCGFKIVYFDKLIESSGKRTMYCFIN